MASVVQFHRELNPKLWQGTVLNPLVRLKLFRGALAFYKFLDVDRLIVSDIILTGSNAAYNYTPLSDLDVHLIVDVSHGACPDLAENLFQTKKALWSATYDVSVYDLPVEFYVQDGGDLVANGIYSILRNTWLKKPMAIKPEANDAAIRSKRDAYAGEIEALLNGAPTTKDIDAMFERLRTLRQSGLLFGGEFSTENLAWKALRADGLLQKLYDRRIALTDDELSLS